MFVVVVVEVVLVLGMLVAVGGPALTGGSLGGGKRWKIRPIVVTFGQRWRWGEGWGRQWKEVENWAHGTHFRTTVEKVG